MKFAKFVVSVGNMKFAAPAEYTGPAVTDTVPQGAIQLEYGDDEADKELAVRLLTESDKTIVFTGNNCVINASQTQTGTSPTALVAMGADLKRRMLEAGAGDAFANAPQNFGESAVRSYFPEITDAESDFLKWLCMGETRYNDAYNGILPTPQSETVFTNDGRYAVMTSTEADTAAEAIAQQRLLDALDETPDWLGEFVNRDAAIAHVIDPANGGRASLLAVDGLEHTVVVVESETVDSAANTYYLYLVA